MTTVNNNLSKEEILSSAPELEVDSEDSEEEEVLKETPGSPISKRNDDDDAKYIVPKMDLTYSLRDEENKEERIAKYSYNL